MKRLLTLLIFILSILNTITCQDNENTFETVKFLAIDGNYDYEIIYFKSHGEIYSLINLSHLGDNLNKGDKIRIKKTTETIEVAGDQSFHEEEVVTEISLLEKGTLSRFLETNPNIEYKISSQFSGHYTELIKNEINLFLAASTSPSLREMFERTDGGTIEVLAIRFIQGRDGTIENMQEHETAIYCSISYQVGNKDEAILRFALIPDYAKSTYYGITQRDEIYPITLVY